MRTFWSLCLLAIAAFLLSEPLPATTLNETWKKQLQAEDKKGLSVKNANGSIQVESWNEPLVEIVAFLEVKGSTSEEARNMLDAIEIDVDDSGEVIRVETRLPHKEDGNESFLSRLFDFFDNQGSVRYEIRVPETFDLDLHSTNGKIEAVGCEGQIRLETTNGKILAKQMAGAVNAHSTNGSVRIELDKVYNQQDMDIRTTNGSVYVYLPPDANAELEAHTTNGRVNVDIPGARVSSGDSGHVKTQINKGGTRIYIKTTNGSIHIRE